MTELLKVYNSNHGVNPQSTIPDFLCSQFERPNKKEAVKEKQTRFM